MGLDFVIPPCTPCYLLCLDFLHLVNSPPPHLSETNGYFTSHIIVLYRDHENTRNSASHSPALSDKVKWNELRSARTGKRRFDATTGGLELEKWFNDMRLRRC
jgi:hypothetical protein